MSDDRIRMALGSVKDILQEQDKEKKKKKSLLEEFDTIDKKYGADGGLGLERIEYRPPSDEEIEEIAKNALLEKYQKGRDGIEQAIAASYGALEKKKQDAEQTREEQLKKIDDYYAERKKEAEREAIKRGLARSSVIMEQIEEFDRGKIDKKLEAERDIEAYIREVTDQINSLESQKEKALSDHDVLYAAELANKIYQLKEDRDKKLIEAIKYNNTVQEKEAKYADGNNTGLLQLAAEEKLAAAKSYFDGMSKAKALEELLSGDDYKKHLGAYYSYLLNYINSKK